MQRNKLDEEISNKLEELSRLPLELKKEKNDDIKKMINYYISLTDKIEDRRIRIYNFSLQILAISVTALAFLISQERAIKDTYLGCKLFICSIIVVAILIVASLISGVFYQFQSWYRYPFLKERKYGNKWKWFYYGNEKILEMSANPFAGIKKKEQSRENYLKGLLFFISNYKEETLDKEIKDNVQQLYLLQVHNYYKNRFYLQLTKIWQIVYIGIGAIILLFLFIIFLD